MTNDFENYKWSSYKKILDSGPSKLKKQEILDWFAGAEQFIQYHKEQADYYKPDSLFVED